MKPSSVGAVLATVLSSATAVTAGSSTPAVGEVTRRAAGHFAENGLAAREDFLDEILDDLEDLVECSACEALLVVLQALAHTGNQNFVDVITDVCELAGIEDDDVCAGAIALEGPILAHDLREMTVGSKTSQLFCLTVFGLCQWPDVDTGYSPVNTTRPGNLTRPGPSGRTPLQVVHFTDIHVDLEYEVGASYNCTKNICCRPYDAADAPGNTSYPAGPYGNPACDAPLSLEESMYAAIRQLAPNASFSIFTGDVVEGAVWATTDAEVTADLDSAYGRMQALGHPVYGAVGNHDSSPVNSFPPAAVDTTITTQWAYEVMSEDWAAWIGGNASASVADNYGAYSYVDASGLKIVSFNTMFYYKQNFWMFEPTMEYDPSGQFAWLVAELQAAEDAGQRVWLLGHMPMGTTDAFHDASYYFDLVVQRYQATIAGAFYGHTHQDEFEIAYSDYSNQTAQTANMISYIAPSMTPTSGNPSFRVYSVDPVTFGVLDMTVYYANISSPSYQSGPTWEVLYSVKDAYGPLLNYTDPAAELTPAFWHNLTALFEDDDAVFQAYYARKTRDYDNSTCTDDCKTDEICQLRAAQAQYDCGTVSPGVNFKRDLHTGATTAGECESSGAIPILSSIYSSGKIQTLKTSLTKVLGEEFLHSKSNYTITR
ncbi:calcineurin-like phosphoesterase [Xylariaceae sp. FL0804]|nr:calcineurin-like phosphoesterase [Xylariaceae sp. FL0804]